MCPACNVGVPCWEHHLESVEAALGLRYLCDSGDWADRVLVAEGVELVYVAWRSPTEVSVYEAWGPAWLALVVDAVRRTQHRYGDNRPKEDALRRILPHLDAAAREAVLAFGEGQPLALWHLLDGLPDNLSHDRVSHDAAPDRDARVPAVSTHPRV